MVRGTSGLEAVISDLIALSDTAVLRDEILNIMIAGKTIGTLLRSSSLLIFHSTFPGRDTVGSHLQWQSKRNNQCIEHYRLHPS